VGNSQGASLIAAALTDSTTNVRDQVKGAVLFGYTRNQQNNGTIPGYPADRTVIYCDDGDTVCDGLPAINLPAHISYLDEALGPAPGFLASKV
jgi:cutinase